MKIRYKDVCSIRNSEVEFPLGKLVAITGETNQGKSALFYTVLAGFTNSPEFKKFINNDALREDPKAFAWIGLYDEKGNQFHVAAGTNFLHYKTNDAKYEKVGRKSIFEVMQGQIPGLLYDPEDSRQIMNIQGEDDGFFPIDRTDSQIFKTYERLLSLSNTSDVLTAIKLDMEDVNIKMTDMLKTVQQCTESSSKIDALFEKIDVGQLQKSIDYLEQLENSYNTMTQAYNSIKRTSEYLQLFHHKPAMTSLNFDVNSFNIKLNDLVKANNIIKYKNLTQKEFAKAEFDSQKAVNIAQDLSVAILLKEELDSLKEEIRMDNIHQREISIILGSIKTCPLCGKPMEACND